MPRAQLNVRISDTLETAIDEKRIALRQTLGYIPTRSDVLRMALEAYLGVTLGSEDDDGRSSSGPARRRVGAGARKAG